MIKKFIFYYYFILFAIENRKYEDPKKYDWITPYMQVSLITMGLLFLLQTLFYGVTGIIVSLNPRITGIILAAISFGGTYILLFKIWGIRDQEDISKFIAITKRDKINAYIIFFASLLLIAFSLTLDFFFDWLKKGV